jgi:hypothetical protein
MPLPFRAEAACVLACLLLSGCGTPSQPGLNVVQEQMRSAGPLNSSPAQVLDSLEQRHIAHSRLHRDETFGNVIEAEINIPTPHVLVDPTYDVLFIFDDQGKLTKYNVGFLGYVGP